MSHSAADGVYDDDDDDDECVWQVSCLAVWENCLYVGTQCGLVVYYYLEEQKSALGKVLYQSKIKGRIQLGSERVRTIIYMPLTWLGFI